MSFQAFECEQPMPCGETCIRLYGHKDSCECEGDQAMRIGRQFLAERTPGEVQPDDSEWEART